MKEYGFRQRVVCLLSGISVLLSLLSLLAVVRYCYPEVEKDVRRVVCGVENSPVRQAFYTLADDLEAGVSLGTAMKDTVKVLFE